MTRTIKNITFPIAAAVFLAAFIIPPAIIAEEFKYDKEGLIFVLEYSGESTLGPLKSKAEVFRATAPGQAYEVKWMFEKTTRLTTNGLFAYKNGYRIFVSVTHVGNPLEINHVVKSLKFL